MLARGAILLAVCSVLARPSYGQDSPPPPPPTPELASFATQAIPPETVEISPIPVTLFKTAVVSPPTSVTVFQAEVASPLKQAARSKQAQFAAWYGGYVSLQLLDVYSTTTALSSGAGREGNVFMKGAASNPASLLMVKAASTALVVYGTEKLRKRHRVTAMVMMAAIDTTLAVVVKRNYSVR
jgi:hypothetical protein